MFHVATASTIREVCRPDARGGYIAAGETSAGAALLVATAVALITWAAAVALVGRGWRLKE